MILEPQKMKSDTVYSVSPTISHEVMGPDAKIFVFWMLSFKPTFSLTWEAQKEQSHCKSEKKGYKGTLNVKRKTDLLNLEFRI